MYWSPVPPQLERYSDRHELLDYLYFVASVMRRRKCVITMFCGLTLSRRGESTSYPRDPWQLFKIYFSLRSYFCHLCPRTLQLILANTFTLFYFCFTSHVVVTRWVDSSGLARTKNRFQIIIIRSLLVYIIQKWRWKDACKLTWTKYQDYIYPGTS